MPPIMLLIDNTNPILHFGMFDTPRGSLLTVTGAWHGVVWCVQAIACSFCANVCPRVLCVVPMLYTGMAE